MTEPLILAIDTSCDDTSAAVTCGTAVWSNVVASQVQLHKQYGGVFPTVAKQAHRENIAVVVEAARKKAGVAWGDIAAIAVTQGPGLAPALEIGVETAKQLAIEKQLPLIPVNHIEGHLLSCLAHAKTATPKVPLQFPVIGIVVSGKQTSFVLVKNIGEYEILGETVDDAAGEALDKFGRMIDLGYPAGPLIEQFALKGNSHAYTFPLPMTTSGNANMSFSGMKTSARNLIEKLEAEHPLTQQDIYDLCASFQTAVFRAITYKLSKVLQQHQVFGIWLGGGVAANVALRSAIRTTIRPQKLRLFVPYTKRLCIDNAAMIGVVAGFMFQRGEEIKNVADIQKIERLPRWKIGVH